MQINEIESRVIRIPFKEPFKHSLASRNYAENVIVRVGSDMGEAGYGESVPREYVTGENIESVLTALSEYWAPLLLKQNWKDPSGFIRFLTHADKEISDLSGKEPETMPAARCAVELALIDLMGKHFRLNAGELLGWKNPVPVVFYSGVISGGTLRKAVQKARMMKFFGFRDVKLKVGGEDDSAKIAAVRKTLGSKIDLRLDANGAWTPEEAVSKINSWQPFRISAVEQPVPKEDLKGMSQVTSHTDADVIADESFSSMQDARILSESNGCDILNIRISKCGGLFKAHEIAQFALENNLKIQLGCQVGESAILSGAGRIFAQYHPQCRYYEGSYERHLLRRDISENRIRFGFRGKGAMITGPGLGVKVDTKKLDRMTIKRWVVHK